MNEVRLSQPFLHITMPNHSFQEDIALAPTAVGARLIRISIYVDQGRVRLHRQKGIKDSGKFVIFHTDKLQGFFSGLLVEGGHGSDWLPDIAHLILS
jgi:hypothetical protein